MGGVSRTANQELRQSDRSKCDAVLQTSEQHLNGLYDQVVAVAGSKHFSRPFWKKAMMFWSGEKQRSYRQHPQYYCVSGD